MNIEINHQKRLHEQATNILHRDELWKVFNKSGKIHVGGSTFLELLVYPDLDLYFETDNEEQAIATFSEAGQCLISNSKIRRFKVEKAYHKLNPALPKGIFLGIKYLYSNEITWKIDMWYLEKEKLDEVLHARDEIFNMLNEENRKIILQFKTSLINSKGRTPSLSSFHIYNAVLKEKVTSFEDLKEYLKEQKIEL